MILLQKCEQALAAILEDAIVAIPSDVSVYQGKSFDDKSLPCVVVSAVTASEDDPPMSQNRWVTCEVTIRTAAMPQESEDTVAESNDLVDAIQSALRSTTIAADLSAEVDDFYCYYVSYDGETRDNDDSNWFETYSIRLYCISRD